jgi:adenine-specific DNA-methyltransferase
MYFPFFVNPKTKQVSLKKDKDFSAEVIPKLSDGEDGRWRWGKDTAEARLDELTGDQVGPESRWDVFQIDFAETESGVKRIKPKTVWMGPEFANEAGNLEVKKLFGKTVFDTCKPVGLINYCIEQAMDKDGIVLDFFAGSGTTAQSVLETNNADGGTRKFILVQLPEQVDKEGYKTISDITKERVRRVIKKITTESEKPKELKIGFKVFKLDESNFKTWNTNPESGLQKQLELHVDHVLPNRSQDDILFEILFKSGFSLTTNIEKQTIAKKTVFSVAGGMLLICLEKDLTLELIRSLAELKPERVVCLDQGFAGNDQLKTNAVQIFRTKGIASFKTV